jgi:hypothetical protein
MTCLTVISVWLLLERPVPVLFNHVDPHPHPQPSLLTLTLTLTLTLNPHPQSSPSTLTLNPHPHPHFGAALLACEQRLCERLLSSFFFVCANGTFRCVSLSLSSWTACSLSFVRDTMPWTSLLQALTYGNGLVVGSSGCGRKKGKSCLACERNIRSGHSTNG